MFSRIANWGVCLAISTFPEVKRSIWCFKSSTCVEYEIEASVKSFRIISGKKNIRDVITLVKYFKKNVEIQRNDTVVWFVLYFFLYFFLSKLRKICLNECNEEFSERWRELIEIFLASKLHIVGRKLDKKIAKWNAQFHQFYSIK